MTAYKPSGRLSIRHVMLTLHNLLEEDQTNQSQKETMEITGKNEFYDTFNDKCLVIA